MTPKSTKTNRRLVAGAITMAYGRAVHRGLPLFLCPALTACYESFVERSGYGLAVYASNDLSDITLPKELALEAHYAIVWLMAAIREDIHKNSPSPTFLTSVLNWGTCEENQEHEAFFDNRLTYLIFLLEDYVANGTGARKDLDALPRPALFAC